MARQMDSVEASKSGDGMMHLFRPREYEGLNYTPKVNSALPAIIITIPLTWVCFRVIMVVVLLLAVRVLISPQAYNQSFRSPCRVPMGWKVRVGMDGIYRQ